MEESLVLFSGGIDSTTALYWALGRCEKVHTLTFDYGQRHNIEILMAERLVRRTAPDLRPFQERNIPVHGFSLG